jgi:CheY-like chemotaxis protein
MIKNRIMIIDNNADQLYTMKAIFEEDGNVEIISAKSVEECLDFLEQGIHPNLIISETIMPGTDGFYLYHFLKDRQDLKNIPLVFLTAWNVNWDEHKEISKNTTIIEKPINSDDLNKIVYKTIMKKE